MKIRVQTKDDFPAIFRLWNEATFDRAPEQVIYEKIWGDEGIEPQLRICVVDGAELVGFAVAIGPKENSTIGSVKMIAVQSDHQRTGIGSRMLSRLESALASRATELRVAESVPNYLTPGVDTNNAAANAFFQYHNFERFGEAVNQRVDLIAWSTSNRPSRAAGYQTRRARLDDEPSVRQWILQHWPAWHDEVCVALHNETPTLFLAIENDRIIGFAAHDANNQGTGWFGPMGTIPECEGRGVGGELLRHCLADMHEQGYAHATIPWVGPLEFYAKQAGAVIDRRFNRYRKQLKRPLE